MLELLLNPVGSVAPSLAIVVVIVGMVLLAVWDLWREEVEDWATFALLIGAVAALAHAGVTPTQWLNAGLGAAVAFVVYLWLGTKGVMGGGDVKLSIVPALVLGATNPLLALWWIAGSIAIHQLLAHAVLWSLRLASDGKAPAVALPHVPAMTIGLVAAVTIFPV